MPIFHVHLYVAGRVKFAGIEADSQEDAFAKACEKYDPQDFFHGDDSRDAAVTDEGAPLGGLVDEADDEDFSASRYHQGEGAFTYIDDGNKKVRGHVAKKDENVLIHSMGKKFRIRAMFDNVEAANEFMGKHPDTGVIASFGPIHIIANLYEHY